MKPFIHLQLVLRLGLIELCLYPHIYFHGGVHPKLSIRTTLPFTFTHDLIWALGHMLREQWQ
jgi:hypothetical protein